MKRHILNLAVILAAGIVQAGRPVEIENAGFERLDAKGWPIGWSKAKNWSAARDGHNGSGGLVYSCPSADQYVRSRPSQRVRLEPDKRYIFSALVRADGLTTERKTTAQGITLYMEGYDARGKWLFGATAKPCASGRTREWQKVVGLTREIPEGVVRACVQPFVNGKGVGRAVIDNIYVEEYEISPVEGVYTDRYRHEAVTGPVRFSASINTERGVPLADYSAAFAYVAADGAQTSVAGRIVSEDEATVTIEADAFALGTNDVVCTLSRKGTVLGSAKTPFARLATPLDRRVIIDGRHRTLVDGRPFFPLGMYFKEATPSNLDAYLEGPFNVLMPYKRPTKEQLDDCLRRGIMVIYNLQGAFTEEDAGKAWVTERVREFRDHPAILAWYTNDEKPLTDIPKLTMRQRWIEELDKDHPTWSVQDVFSEIRHYLPTYDVLGMDPYPIGRGGKGGPLETVISSLRQGASGTFGTRAVWQVPQAFGWNWLRRSETRNAVAPNRRELANMTWQSIAGGANGLVYYSYHTLTTEHATHNNDDEITWEDMKSVAREVKRYEEVLVSGEAAPAVSGGTDAIAVRTWAKDGETWLLAVNCTTNPATATLEFPVRYAGIADCAFGPRPVLTDGKRLEIAFGPRDYAMLRLTKEAADVSVVRHDFSSVRIVVPDKAPRRVREAADELRAELKLVCGSEIRDDAAFSFVLGAPSDAAPLRPFESRYRVEGSTVYLWGDVADGPEVPRDGCFFAVSLFLERELGVHWLWEGRDGISFEPRRTVALPKFREASFESALVRSEIRNYPNLEIGTAGWRACNGLTPVELRDMDKAYLRQSHADRALWLRRMRLQDRRNLRYGHAFVDWKRRFGKTHPEYLNWNAERKQRGVTVGDEPKGVKLCVSNEAVVDQILADWKRKGLPEYLCVCENDHRNFCACDACRALDADEPGEAPLTHLTDRYCNFWNRLARKAVGLRADVKLIAYAYSAYRKPPRRERIDYPENVLLGFVPSVMDDATPLLDAWRARGMRHFFLRPNFHHYGASIPRGYERIIYDSFHDCLSRGMMAVDYDAPAHRDLMNLEYYVTARMVADPKAAFEDICGEYYGGFGAAAADVKEYCEAVRRDGEAARHAFMRYRTEHLTVLDDSELAHLQAYGYEEPKLRRNADLIAAAYRRWKGRLPEVCERRLENLRLLAEQGVLAFRHIEASASAPSEEFSRRGRELVAFRVANRAAMREDWPTRFGAWGGEVRIWRKDPLYRIVSCDAGTLDPRGVKYGWSQNFESMGYGQWRRLSGDSEIVNARASNGGWSCRLDAEKRSSIVNDNLMVLPGRTYRLTADLFAEGEVGGAEIRVQSYGVPERNLPGRLLVERRIDAAELGRNAWRTFDVSFTAPTEFPQSRAKWGADYVACVFPRVSVAGGATGSAVYVDNIRVAIVES